MGGPRDVHHVCKTGAGAQPHHGAGAHTAPPRPPAGRSAAPGFSWLSRLDPRPPSLDFLNHPEALPTQVLQLARRFGAPGGPALPHPSPDEVWRARWSWAPVLCTRVRRPQQSRQDGRVRPGSSERRAWLGTGCAEEGLGGQDKKSRHSRAVGPSPRGRELLGGLSLRARARTRLWLLTHTGTQGTLHTSRVGRFFQTDAPLSQPRGGRGAPHVLRAQCLIQNSS